MDVSVLLATYKRPDMLRDVLASFEAMDVHGLSWEVVVADNAAEAVTESVVREFSDRLPLRCVVESRQGKNFALNTGLGLVSGELVVFTDDDIRADEKWLQALVRARRERPEISIFAGRILPEFPRPGFSFELPEGLHNSAFCINDFGEEELLIPADKVWGANMAIARTIFDEGHRFNTDIGPSSGQYAMGSEVEFTTRLERHGYQALFVPGALVWHRIREEQLTTEWLESRMFRMGRGHVALNGLPEGVRWLGVPRHLVRQIIELTAQTWAARIKSDDYGALRSRLLCSYARGQAYQCRVENRDD